MLTELAAVAIIILAVEAMLCLLIPLALTIGVAYVLVRTRQFLPPKFRVARLQAQRVNSAVKQAGDKVTGSLATAEGKLIETETLARTLFGQTKRD